jgi:hypothetical protein
MKETEAARAVLLEVLNALGAMRDELVIVGGWVPDLLYPASNHMGSLDVDLAVSPNAIGGSAYSSIRERLTQLGYTMQESPTRFFKHLPDLANPIKIDLITGLYVSQHRQDSVLVDEIRINAVRGIDLAFEASETITVDGRMPDGSINRSDRTPGCPRGIHLDQGDRDGRTNQRQGRVRHCICFKPLPTLSRRLGEEG